MIHHHLRKIYRTWLTLREPSNPTSWHEWSVLWPRRSPNGDIVSNNVWRRRRNDRWEYLQRDETDDEWSSRQW